MQFDGMVYQRKVGIPMGTNCAPLIADLFLYCYEGIICQTYRNPNGLTLPASQAGDADSFRTPGLTSGLQGSVHVHRGALLLVPQ